MSRCVGIKCLFPVLRSHLPLMPLALDLGLPTSCPGSLDMDLVPSPPCHVPWDLGRKGSAFTCPCFSSSPHRNDRGRRALKVPWRPGTLPVFNSWGKPQGSSPQSLNTEFVGAQPYSGVWVLIPRTQGLWVWNAVASGPEQREAS